jgi:hypothetical protein
VISWLARTAKFLLAPVSTSSFHFRKKPSWLAYLGIFIAIGFEGNIRILNFWQSSEPEISQDGLVLQKGYGGLWLVALNSSGSAVPRQANSSTAHTTKRKVDLCYSCAFFRPGTPLIPCCHPRYALGCTPLILNVWPFTRLVPRKFCMGSTRQSFMRNDDQLRPFYFNASHYDNGSNFLRSGAWVMKRTSAVRLRG